MKVIINGADGAMGHVIEALCEKGVCGAEVAALVDNRLKTDPGEHKYTSLKEYDGPADVVIDFSSHLATDTLTKYCVSRKIPLLIATTGQSEEENAIIEKAALVIPIFKSANMSLGIAVLNDLAKRVAKFFRDAEIEIVETHHDRKVDVPSGTALMLANGIREVRPDATLNIGRPDNGKRSKGEIGIHSLRYGNVVGVHEVIISTGNETIKLVHEADNRSLFADGAMKAAEFISKETQPGLYGMDSIMK